MPSREREKHKARCSAMEGEPAGRTDAYDYDLPPELIADRPASARDASRLLVLDRATATRRDATFPELLDQLAPGDAVVVNDSRVFPARFLGQKPTGARAEILLIRPEIEEDEIEGGGARDLRRSGSRLWRAMVRPGGKLKPGRTVEIAAGFEIEILDSAADGTRLVRLIGDADPWDLIDRFGHIPLPPYIDRPDDDDDRERYQTVYARALGSVAAPTAGLHFTPELLDDLAERRVERIAVTLHVGCGTFRPVSADRIDDHEVSPEVFTVSEAAADRLNQVRAAGGRVWAIGTTSCRVLESISRSGVYEPGSGTTDLFIRPPHEFRGVDGLVTNFHLPRSSLLMLVAAFAGRELVLTAYEHAIRSSYRFYSYGDAMLIT